MRFYLKFLSDSFGTKEIDEPIGYAEVDFNVRQEQGRMARDISLNGDSLEFEFSYMRNHYLDQLLYYFNKFGFEAKVHLLIEIDENTKYLTELDFAQAETDELEYFRCKAIEITDKQILKRRKEVKVDLTSSKNIDGDYIPPLVPQNLLIKSTPTLQKSLWEQTSSFDRNLSSWGSDDPTGGSNTNFYHVNPAQQLSKAEINDSLTFFDVSTKFKNTNDAPKSSDYKILEAVQGSYRNLNVNIKDLEIDMRPTTADGGNGYVSMEFSLFYGESFDTAQKITLLNTYNEENRNFFFKGNLSAQIPTVERGQSVWLLMIFKVRQSTTVTAFNNPKFNCQTVIKDMKVEVDTEVSTFNSVCESYDLYDVLKQVVKSSANMDIIAPIFQKGGELYGNRVLNGNQLRRLKNKSFTVSLDQIEKCLIEMHCDYEITPDGKVFFGRETDFYTSNEIGFFPNTQFSEMSVTFNPKYSINEFSMKYRNYQSLKENTVAGTSDSIHGESKYVLPNKSVENKKSIEIEWCRDSIMIHEMRGKGVFDKEDTTTQDDDSLFVIDCKENSENPTFTEFSKLSHEFDVSLNRLILRNDGSFNFNALGLIIDTKFVIQPNDQNAGDYLVKKISNNEIQLLKTSSGAISASANGIRNTKYIYTLDKNYIPFTNRTNEGVEQIFNITGADRFLNLRYSVGRNINRFWQSYLASCNLYRKTETLKNTFYKNNGKAEMVIDGVMVNETMDIIPQNPICTPRMFNKVVFSNVSFADFVVLQNKLRTERGFIRAIDNNEKVIKIFPSELTYMFLEKELEVKGEEKFEPIAMSIVKNSLYLTINNETITDKVLYELKGEKVYIYDQNRQLLYNAVFWHELSINGALAKTKNEMIEWLKLL